MNSTSLHKELISKRQKLQEITISLKDRFLGLESVIDEVISLMMPWYLFPEAQLRPTIINLWGLTGSGKTALVQRIVELLEYRKYYTHMDMVNLSLILHRGSKVFSPMIWNSFIKSLHLFAWMNFSLQKRWIPAVMN